METHNIVPFQVVNILPVDFIGNTSIIKFNNNKEIIIFSLYSKLEKRISLYLEKIRRKTNIEINENPKIPVSCNTSK